MSLKRCPSCKETKSVEDFPNNRSSKDGKATYCKPCHNIKTKEARDKVGGSRNYHLKRRYGVTSESFNIILNSQNNKCAICNKENPTHLDHEHNSSEELGHGRVRGILCVSCNNGIGLFKDNPDLLRKAAEYLGGE